MEWLESLVLGVVQGITEFLPIRLPRARLAHAPGRSADLNLTHSSAR